MAMSRWRTKVINSMTNLSLDCIYGLLDLSKNWLHSPPKDYLFNKINRIQFISVRLFMLLNRVYQHIKWNCFMTPICLIEWFTIYGIYFYSLWGRSHISFNNLFIHACFTCTKCEKICRKMKVLMICLDNPFNF